MLQCLSQALPVVVKCHIVLLKTKLDGFVSFVSYMWWIRKF